MYRHWALAFAFALWAAKRAQNTSADEGTLVCKSKVEREKANADDKHPNAQISNSSEAVPNEKNTKAPLLHMNSEFQRKHPNAFGCELVPLKSITLNEVMLLKVPHLAESLPGGDRQYSNTSRVNSASSHGDNWAYNKLMTSEDVILGDIRRNPTLSGSSRAYLRAGPRKSCFFEPSEVCAAIVTCGGLCPGLNNVIREITLALIQLYGVKQVYGVKGGYAGFHFKDDGASSDVVMEPIDLTPKVVQTIHKQGGTILSSSRGGFKLDHIMKFLAKYKITHLYVIGGDGTHRGIQRIYDEVTAQKLRVAVVGIPKTIDNDLDLIDRSFGFNSAVEEAMKAIQTAKTEAQGNMPNGIGIVKLMGRSAGFIASHAVLSSSNCNLCLVPEVPIELEGPNGCLPHLECVIRDQGYAVVVVAEGAGEELLGIDARVDASGNKILPEIGPFLKKSIAEHFKAKGIQTTIKYIDPSYMIRSVPANGVHMKFL